MSTAVASLDYKEIIQPKARFLLYNPSSVQAEADFAGDTYTIPAKGTLPINDLPASMFNPRGKALEKGSGSYREAIPAIDIVRHLVGEDGKSGKLGALGVRCLFGDHRDEFVKAEADEAHAEFQYQQDLKTEYAHNKSVQTAKEAGLPPPVPRQHVKDAIARRVSYESEHNTVPTHPCLQCNWPFWTERELVAHIETTHKDGRGVAASQLPAAPSPEVAALTAQVATLTSLVASLAGGQTKRKGGRPKKAEKTDPTPEAA